MMIPFNHRAVSIKFSRTLLSMLFLGALLVASSQKIQALGTFIPAASRIDMVYDSARDLLYVTNGDSVLRYQVGSNTFLSPFTIAGSNLSGIDLSPDGNTLVVADKRRLDPIVWVYAIDLPTGQTRQVLMTRNFMEGGTYAVAYAKDGTVLTTSIFEGSGWIPLRRLDPITGAWTELAQVRNNSMVTSSGDLGIIGYAEADSSDGPFGRYRVADGNLLKKFGYTDGTAWYNYEIGVNSNGTQYAIPTYNGTYICDANLVKYNLIGEYAGPQPIGVVYHPVENTVYFAWSQTTEVRAFDTNTFTQTAAYDFENTFVNPGNWAFTQGRLKMSRDGSLLFATVNGGVRYLRLYDPLVADSQSLSGSEDIPLPITLTGRVGNGGTVSYVITANPTHGTLSGSGGNLTYTPNSNYSGPDTFKFRATYGAAFSAEATVSLTINPLNDNPNAQPDIVSTGKNMSVSISVLSNDTDVDGDNLTVVAVTQGANGSVNITGSGKTLTYKPRNGFSGTDTFNYTVSDGKGGTATATVTVNVLKK
ncbi:MAG TPA: Ig-like domain-containing protein [Pyrinomonadaceae bacterium]|nr:Ig-like domain-containing protein [Pyrinomonadaceae bacterium]